MCKLYTNMNTLFLILYIFFEMIMPSLFNKAVTTYKSLFYNEYVGNAPFSCDRYK